MEPLTGFFILEGLVFDTIGAILIESSIFAFHYSYPEEIAKQVRKHSS